MLPDHSPPRDRGAVRDAEGAAARAASTSASAGLGNRPAQPSARSAGPHERRVVPARRAGAAALPPRSGAGTGRGGHAGRGHARPALDPRLEPVRRGAGGDAARRPSTFKPSEQLAPDAWSASTRSSPTTTRRAGCSRPCSSTSRTSSAAGGQLRRPSTTSSRLGPHERGRTSAMLSRSYVGSPESVRAASKP